MENFTVLNDQIWLDGTILNYELANTSDWYMIWDGQKMQGVVFMQPQSGTDVVFDYSFTVPKGFQAGRSCKSIYKTGYIDLNNLKILLFYHNLI